MVKVQSLGDKIDDKKNAKKAEVVDTIGEQHASYVLHKINSHLLKIDSGNSGYCKTNHKEWNEAYRTVAI